MFNCFYCSVLDHRPRLESVEQYPNPTISRMLNRMSTSVSSPTSPSTEAHRKKLRSRSNKPDPFSGKSLRSLEAVSYDLVVLRCTPGDWPVHSCIYLCVLNNKVMYH